MYDDQENSDPSQGPLQGNTNKDEALPQGSAGYSLGNADGIGNEIFSRCSEPMRAAHAAQPPSQGGSGDGAPQTAPVGPQVPDMEAKEADRRWFAAHPSRSTYTRAALPGEFDGLPYEGPVVVHQVYPGFRQRSRCDGITDRTDDLGEYESYFAFAMIMSARRNKGFVSAEEIQRIQTEAARRGVQS